MEKKTNGEQHAPPAQTAKSKPRRSKRNPTPIKETGVEDKEGEANKPAAESEPAAAPLLPELPPEADPTKLISEAKEMVESAKEAQSAAEQPPAETGTKRKTEVEEGENDEQNSERVKRAKLLEDKLKRERVRTRALFGVTAALAVA